jgi:transcription elongation factor GreA
LLRHRNPKEHDVTDQATAPTASFLTQDAFDRLTSELAHLTGEGRTEIAKRIEAAREEGDLKENGGYHAAKEEQGKMEARIRQLTQLLENAKVGETPKDDGIVEPGMLVTVEMFGDEETFLLGHREIKDANGPEVFSEQSPLGKAINGKKVGESARYDTPSGKSVDVKILKAAPFTG